MERSSSRLGIVLSAVLVLTLSLPTLRMLTSPKAAGTLHGYSDSIAPRPPSLVRSFFDKSLQSWSEKAFDTSLGFREILVRSFNEVNFRLFSQAPRLRLYSIGERGLYTQMSLDSLNAELADPKGLQQRYRQEALKLKSLQDWLAARGKHFEVVIASSKTYVYADGLGSRFIVGGTERAFERAASFAASLSKAGVNVIDSAPMLRDFTRRTGVSTHELSGVHWNYFAGCMIAARLMWDIREHRFPAAPSIDCGTPHYELSKWVDLDGLLLLNLWSDASLRKMTPYPTIGKIDESSWRPRVLLIGDSFSDQITDPMAKAGAYSRLVTSNYFRTRRILEPGRQPTDEGPGDDARIQASVYQDMLNSDVVLLQMVDYNIGRWNYGFADYLLNRAPIVPTGN